MFENDTGLLLIIGMIVAFEVGAIVLGAVNLEKCPAEPALPVWLIVRERRNTRSLPPRSVYLIFYICLPAPSTSPSRCCCVDDYGHTCKRSWYVNTGTQAVNTRSLQSLTIPTHPHPRHSFLLPTRLLECCRWFTLFQTRSSQHSDAILLRQMKPATSSCELSWCHSFSCKLH